MRQCPDCRGFFVAVIALCLSTLSPSTWPGTRVKRKYLLTYGVRTSLLPRRFLSCAQTSSSVLKSSKRKFS
jgi:hypothetical protein